MGLPSIPSPEVSGPAEVPYALRPHAIVIGAGLGGLAAAIRLGARGYRVTVLDRLREPGGRASVLRQDGFTFDLGPTLITAPDLLGELWALCGRQMADDLTLKPLDPFYRIAFADGSTLDWGGDEATMRARIAAFAPGDVAGYQRVLQESAAIYAVGYEQLSASPFSRLWDMVRAVPNMARMRADRSLYGMVARHVRDERLRTALSFHPLFVGGNPFNVSAIYALILHLERQFGVHYAFGGMGAVVAGLADLVRSQGHTLRLGADVRRILHEDGRATGVELSDGTRLPARIVVSNACVAHTYGKLLADLPRRRWTDRKLAAARYSMGVFLWYFGTKHQYDGIQHHTIQMGPRYRGLLDDIFAKKQLSDDFSLYLHRPSATDPGVAPPGHDAFYALVPVPNLQGNIDWKREAEPLRRRIQAHLEATLLPNLGANLVTSAVMTPQDFETRLLSTHGAGFSLEPTLLQSAWFRPHNRSEELEGLYLVGAGTHPGAGIPGVLCSAKVLDATVPEAAFSGRER
jgi:phytoene desaturase